MKSLRTTFYTLCFMASCLISNFSFAIEYSNNTYTYLRCFYRINPSSITPGTTYVWARDPKTNNYFRVNGYWWSAGAFSQANMFYSDISPDTLLSVCQSTLKNEGITEPLAMYAGADTAASINYTIWKNESPIQQSKINRIVSFGDSLSDMQNMFNASQWTMLKNDSYFAGRFSNGKNWLDFVSDSLHLPVYNWAFGGAAADDYMAIPGVGSQVDSWAIYMKKANGYKPKNTLFTILIGANDLVNYGRTVPSVIESEKSAITKLVKAGGKNILLLNLPDISRAPLFNLRADPESARETAKSQVLDYNEKLENMAADLRKTHGSAINIQIFDSYTMMEFLLLSPELFGFTNTTDSCLDINSESSFNYFYTWYPRSHCTDANTFVFWDSLHPTSRAHELMSHVITDFIKLKYTL